MGERVVVRNVSGRYPRGGVFREENIETQVVEEARVIRIRVDDAEHPESWMEIVLEIEGG